MFDNMMLEFEQAWCSFLVLSVVRDRTCQECPLSGKDMIGKAESRWIQVMEEKHGRGSYRRARLN